MTLAEAVEIVRRRHTPDDGRPRRTWDDPEHYSSHGREVCTVLDALDAALAERDALREELREEDARWTMVRRRAAEQAGIQDPDDTAACMADFVDAIKAAEARAERAEDTERALVRRAEQAEARVNELGLLVRMAAAWDDPLARPNLGASWEHALRSLAREARALLAPEVPR